MDRYQHLSVDERRLLLQLLSGGMKVPAVAAQLGRHPSTIYREIKRNYAYDEHPPFRGYFPVVAHRIAKRRRGKRGNKINRIDGLACYIAGRLRAAWSPEQISGYLRCYGKNGYAVSHETIYQFIYSTEGQSRDLHRWLPTARRSRRRRYGRKPRGLHIPLANSIGHRPQAIKDRDTYGHWEGDLVLFRREFGKANLTSLVERRSRYAVLIRNQSRHSTGVISGINRELGTLPPALRRTITFDRGTEFSRYAMLREQLGIDSYFCQPSAPWQKGSVENSNGRLRRFLPLSTDIALISDEEIKVIADRMNHTPRKCLGYRSPSEVLADQLQLTVNTDRNAYRRSVGLAPPIGNVDKHQYQR
jgi:transposase, IS30 family